MADVQAILEQIELLSDEQRLVLERMLTRRTEIEWKQAVRKARGTAKRRHIGQGEIDSAIERRRYGR